MGMFGSCAALQNVLCKLPLTIVIGTRLYLWVEIKGDFGIYSLHSDVVRSQATDHDIIQA
jgi:hypothetical protein